MENVGTGMYGGDGRTFQLTGVSDVVLMHNTVVSASGYESRRRSTSAAWELARLVVHSNVLHHGCAGVKGDGTTMARASLNTYASGALFTNNAMAYGGVRVDLPGEQLVPRARSADIGFLNAAAATTASSSTSAFVNKGYDGRRHRRGHQPGRCR